MSAGEDHRVESAGGVARVTLARAEVRNAFDDRLIAGLTTTFARLGADPAVRAIVLTGEGPAFSAGADLNWMRRMAGYSAAENRADAGALAELLRAVDRCPRPVVARVQGDAYAGGTGLIAAADIAIAAAGARFAVTEVRLGLIPAVISPYLVRAMGPRWTRRLTLTAERFDAETALRLGLVHEVAPADALDAAVDRVLADLLAGSPDAQASAKALLHAVTDRPIDDDVIADTAARIAAERASPHGREGVASFLEKRPARWTQA